MKKTVLFLFVLFAAITKGRSQNVFAPVGAEWHYVGYQFWYNYWAGESAQDYTWNDHVKSIGDTTISGKICSVLEITRHMRNSTNGPVTTLAPTYQYVYDGADTTFYFDKDSLAFYPLYVWNVQQGDTLCLPHLNKNGFNFCVVIDSVVDVVYDTTHLKTYYTTSYADTSNNPYFILNWGGRIDHFFPESHGSYVEKLGGIMGLFPNFTSTNPDGISEILNPAGNIICYTDSSTKMALGNYTTCDTVLNPRFVTSINDISKSNFQFTISPNPAVAQINIEAKVAFENNTSLTVTDILGRAMIQPLKLDKKKHSVLNVSAWANGIYLFKIQIGEQAYYQKISVQH